MAEKISLPIQIDKHSPIPIYQQLLKQLEQLIADGTWQPKEPLPSETILAAHLQISVMTVRQAMSHLVNRGLIYREKGRGTFVTPQPLEHPLQRLESFSEDMRARGLKTYSRLLAFERMLPSEEIASPLHLTPGQAVLHIKRLRLVDGRAVALHSAYVTVLDIDRQELEANGSLYDALERRGVRLHEADETLEAIVADREFAALMGIGRGAPLLKATRLSRDQSQTPIELVYAFYRADFYRYTVRLRR